MEVINEFEQMLNDTAKTIVENNMEGVDMSDVDIIPVNNNVLIRPYIQNPYRYIETTASGLIASLSLAYSKFACSIGTSKQFRTN